MSETPSQTVGPFLSLGLTWPTGYLVVPEGSPAAIRITGTVRDGAGAPVPDGLVETWQADPDGRFDHPDDPRGPVSMSPVSMSPVSMSPAGSGFTGFGRCATDADGRFTIVTLKPGAIGDGQAPHVDVSVFARGLLDRVVTRIYFPDEAAANAADPLLTSLPPQRASTLIAVPDGPRALRFDIRLQGEGETVFLAI